MLGPVDGSEDGSLLGFDDGSPLGTSLGSLVGMTLVVGVELGISLGTEEGITLMDGIKLGSLESITIFVAFAAVTGSPAVAISVASCSRLESICTLKASSNPVESTVLDEIEIILTITSVLASCNFLPRTPVASNEQDTKVQFTSRSGVSGYMDTT